MASMNFNNWLSFPLSPSQSSISANLQSSQSPPHFGFGLFTDGMSQVEHNQDWNLNNTVGGHDVALKVEDFLGLGNTEQNPSPHDLSAFNHQIQSDFNSSSMAPLLNPLDETSTPEPNNTQALTLSMGSGKMMTLANAETSSGATESIQPKKAIDTFGQRTSIYRGVTRHRWTGRYEAHLWDNSCRREGQSRKGRQVYLGGYDKEEKAARAYDLAALKYWGTSTTTNFPIANYEPELEEMKNMTRQEFVASLRRKSSGFSRGASMYRGVTRHHQQGRWQARIGRVAGNKDLYLGTFSSEEEAAEAYDVAAIKFRGLNAVTNFDMNRYDVRSIMESNLPYGGGHTKRYREAQAVEAARKREEMRALGSSFLDASNPSSFQGYPLLPQLEQQPQPLRAVSNYQNPIYNHEPYFHQHFINAIPLQQQVTSVFQPNQESPFQHTYLPSVHGFMDMGSSSSTMGSNGSYSNNGYSEQIQMNGMLMAAANSSNNIAGGGLGIGSTTSDVGLVKVDYDVDSGVYSSWSADSAHQGAF